MILEGLVTTIAPEGSVNIAPMGPHVMAEPFDRFVLKPFCTAQTLRNLQAHGEGVLHVSDDVLLLARAAVGELEPVPELFPAEHVRGWVLRGACHYFEFRITRCDAQAERAVLEAEIVHTGRLRDFFGFNRAKHAVVEAAILATRTAILPRDEIEAEYRKLAVLVQKTGGPREMEAFTFLQAFVANTVQ
jgi:hypothetical protein